MDDGLEVKFWGTRGSLAAPFPDRMEFGGNTSCVSVRWKHGIAVFDGGTGMAAFGKSLEAAIERGEWDRTDPVFVFVSHVHLDHVAGIPLLPCLFRKGAFVEFFGPAWAGEGFGQRLSKVLGPPYWPVAVDSVTAGIRWHDVGQETRWILQGGARVSAMRANHPDGGYIYRLEYGGQSVVYGLDCELGERQGGPEGGIRGETQEEPGRQNTGWEGETKEPMGSPDHESEGERLEAPDFWHQYRAFARDCSLLIFDAPYTKENYPRHAGFGHSYWQQGLAMARWCNAGYLSICHHDWNRTDTELRAMERELKEKARDWGRPVEFAREGARISLGNRKERNV